MATVAITGYGRRSFSGTPEIYFPKAIDNSRLVKVSDPERSRELRNFLGAMALLLIVVFSYAWQHYSAIEYGYRIEALRGQQEELVENNRQLKLEQEFLRRPGRIDELARQMGLQTPFAGQVVRLEPMPNDASRPVMASVAAVSVISATQ